MTVEAVQTLIVNELGNFGLAAFGILSALILVVVGLLVFRWGAGKLARATGEPSYMQSYNGVNFAAVSRVARQKIRESYPKNTEGI